MLVLLDRERDWGGGSKPTPRQKFSVTSVGVIFNQWGVKLQPPNTPDKSNAGAISAAAELLVTGVNIITLNYVTLPRVEFCISKY